MFCKKCGYFIEDNSKFCTHCGSKIDNITDDNVNTNLQQTITNNTQTKSDDINVAQQNNLKSNISQKQNNTSSNYINSLNKNAKIYAILSIATPAVSLFIYFFIGLSFIMAILLVAIGFDFTKKSYGYNAKMTNISIVLNIILAITAVLMYIVTFIHELG